ncbi:unnamed protein product, partial [Porites evermanni]
FQVIEARNSIHSLLETVQEQQEQFTNIASLCDTDAAIPVAFTKDNRVHIGPKMEMRLVVLGLDGAGKTSILFKMKQDEFVSPITTIGFNVETVEHRSLKFTLWDVIEARNSIHSLLETVQEQQEQFTNIASLCDTDAAIPVAFTKDNRVHIGPKMEMRLVVLGLDGAGKTSILFKMKQDEFVSPITTIGFNVETVEHRSLKFTLWDVGGLQKLRPLWRHYYLNTQAVIFVIDSTNIERISEAHEELAKLMAEKRLKDALLLIFANKQDLPSALTVDSLTEKLALHKLCCGRSWNIFACDAHSGEGLHEGLDWLARQLMSEFAL